jgi:hypothetical protein
MYPDREMLRRWSFCHRQPNCWSRTLEPMGNVLTTEFTLTSQILEVLSPEAESKWVLSGLQLIYSIKTSVTCQRILRVERDPRQQPSILGRKSKPWAGGGMAPAGRAPVSVTSL